MSNETDTTQLQSIKDEIDELERRLAGARARLDAQSVKEPSILKSTGLVTSRGASVQHFLFLLADSALPLGSFAFSSGLESYLAHTRPSSSFQVFLTISVSSFASTTLPFVLAAHRSPDDLAFLDDSLDAGIMCTVGRRSSVAQGRALLSIWDRSFKASISTSGSIEAYEALQSLNGLARSNSNTSSAAGSEELPLVSAHLAPLFGAIAAVLGLDLQQTAYVFMLNHVKALLSAAVRASIIGPYQAQKLLAGVEIQRAIENAINQQWQKRVEDAGQSIPVMDLWVGRHELLYSRIFNS